MKSGSNSIHFLALASAALVTILVSATPAMARQRGHAVEPSLSAGSADGTASSVPLGTLTNLVVRRLLISDQVAASKFGTSKPIDDPVREQQVLDEVRQRAATMDLNPEATARFFQDQINASKVVQEGDFNRWRAHPDEAPTTRPDLDKVRVQLDALTTELLDELKTTQQLRDRPLACSAQLAAATQTGGALNRLNALHRHALDVATRSICATAWNG